MLSGSNNKNEKKIAVQVTVTEIMKTRKNGKK